MRRTLHLVFTVLALAMVASPAMAQGNPCNPCGPKAKTPGNPCGGKAKNPCNPCGGQSAAPQLEPVNPCHAKFGTVFHIADAMGRNQVTFSSQAPLEDIVGTTNQIVGYLVFDPDKPRHGVRGHFKVVGDVGILARASLCNWLKPSHREARPLPFFPPHGLHGLLALLPALSPQGLHGLSGLPAVVLVSLANALISMPTVSPTFDPIRSMPAGPVTPKSARATSNLARTPRRLPGIFVRVLSLSRRNVMRAGICTCLV